MALDHPWTEPPRPGAAIDVLPGIKWLRMPLPFRLDHINLWLLDDGPGWTVVDTGIGLEETRALWERVFAETLDGRPLTRVVVTHFHPDHMGNAGWLTERWRAGLWCTQAEWLYAQWAWLSRDAAAREGRLAHYRRHGCVEAALAQLAGRLNPYPKLVPTLAHEFHGIRDGDTLVVGGRRWEVVTAYGHAPEHACLYCPTAGVLISGDQVLPKITTNVSVWPEQPMANPLRLYLDAPHRVARATRAPGRAPARRRPPPPAERAPRASRACPRDRESSARRGVPGSRPGPAADRRRAARGGPGRRRGRRASARRAAWPASSRTRRTRGRGRRGVAGHSPERGEPPEDRLGREPNAEPLEDAGLELRGEGDDVARLRALVRDDGERVAGGEADRPVGVAAPEAGAFDEPGGGELHARVRLDPARHRGIAREGFDARAVGGADDRVGEERPAAPAVRVAWVEHHRFRAADGEHGLAHLRERWGGHVAGRQVTLDVGVAHGGRAAGPEPVGDGQHDPALRLDAPEAAVAVAEAALRGGERAELAALRVEDAHRRHRVAHLLTVGPDVLDGRRADEAGDAAQALEPRPAALDARAHEIVPRLAGRRRQLHRAVHRARRDPAERDPRDDRRDSLVGDDEVRAAAEDAEGEPATPRPRARVQEPGLVAHLDEVARRAADTERAVRPERDVLGGRRRGLGPRRGHGSARVGGGRRAREAAGPRWVIGRGTRAPLRSCPRAPRARPRRAACRCPAA